MRRRSVDLSHVPITLIVTRRRRTRTSAIGRGRIARLRAIRVRGLDHTISRNPLTRNVRARSAHIPTSPRWGEVELLAQSQRNRLQPPPVSGAYTVY